jgi:hypothetical protein
VNKRRDDLAASYKSQLKETMAKHPEVIRPKIDIYDLGDDLEESDAPLPPPRAPKPAPVETPPASPPLVVAPSVLPTKPASVPDREVPDKALRRRGAGSFTDPYVLADGTEKVKWGISAPPDFVVRMKLVQAKAFPLEGTRGLARWVIETLLRESDRLLEDER